MLVNHCAPDAQRSELLDAFSTSQEPLSRYAHIHCWHTDEKFSKHHFMSGRYTLEDAQDLRPAADRDDDRPSTTVISIGARR